MTAPDPTTVIDRAMLWPVDPLGLFVNGFGWVQIKQEPDGHDFIWPHFDVYDAAIFNAVYPRYGSKITAYTLGKPVEEIIRRAQNGRIRRHVPPKACTEAPWDEERA